MSRMILDLHDALRRLGGVVLRHPHVKSFASNPTPPTKPPPPPPDADEPAPMTIVQAEIRMQERLFQIKAQRAADGDVATVRKLNASHLEDNVKLEMLRGGGSPPFHPIGANDQDISLGQDIRNKLFFDTNRVSQILANLQPDSALRRPPGTKPASSREIIYPKNMERLQVNFKVATSDKEEKVVPPPPPPTTPKFEESPTHKIKVLFAGSEVKSRILNLQSTQTLNNLPNSQATPVSSAASAINAETEVKSADLQVSSDISQVSPDISQVSPDISLPVNQITSVLTKQNLRVIEVRRGKLVLKETTKTLTDSTKTKVATDQNSNLEQDDADDSTKRKKQWTRLKYTMGILGLITGVCGGCLMVIIGSPKYDDEGNLIPDEYSEMSYPLQFYHRNKDAFDIYNKFIKEPSRDKLLPDVLEDPYYQPPYTLVLEFTDLLVHPEWTYQSGWRFKKRPGVDQFLQALYTKFEIVVYTAQMGTTVFPILETLDPKNMITYKLFRDATNFVDGDHVKDLDKINRDLTKVIVIDWNDQSVKLHKSNLFKIPRWEGNDDDNTLYDLATFLLAIADWEIEDVRAVLQYYAQFDNPLAKFKENQLHALQAS